MKLMRDEHIHPKHIDRILYADEAEHLLMASRGVALLTKASALKLDGKLVVARPLEEDALCLDEWIAARGDDNSRLVSGFVRAFVTRSTIVLQPSQMILPIEIDFCFVLVAFVRLAVRKMRPGSPALLFDDLRPCLQVGWSHLVINHDWSTSGLIRQSIMQHYIE